VTAMPKAPSGRRPAYTGERTVETEIAHLRDLGFEGIRARWRTAFKREAPAHLQKHLLFAMVAYRLQAEVFDDLDVETLRFLRQVDRTSSQAAVVPLTERFEQCNRGPSLGTIVTREWNGRHHRVMVLEEGFAWEGRTYKSLSEIAKAITGTKWNGPRFFGLRDMKQAEAAE
jgi:DUF2924 family protein